MVSRPNSKHCCHQSINTSLYQWLGNKKKQKWQQHQGANSRGRCSRGQQQGQRQQQGTVARGSSCSSGCCHTSKSRNSSICKQQDRLHWLHHYCYCNSCERNDKLLSVYQIFFGRQNRWKEDRIIYISRPILYLQLLRDIGHSENLIYYRSKNAMQNGAKVNNGQTTVCCVRLRNF